ncbi:helicase primase subunit [Psittacid alphaherpesvirus 5]|uniref:Helicase primase subunit n=1 Tax=Psittacid alphaherpesvirus 5 TaxID=2972693 RepID=A0A5P9JX44_9ALPH|nr:helicase primase subunit [Psittacid alphaherpesvirus 5]QFU14594.1 helicase primase subunit [Psittacid alphaherpesvirus 5]UOO01065.1 helicase primase subunit [Psittacid alphaherpesvirus 5]
MWVLFELACVDTLGENLLLYIAEEFSIIDLNRPTWLFPNGIDISQDILDDLLQTLDCTSEALSLSATIKQSVNHQAAWIQFTGFLLHEIRYRFSIPRFYTPVTFFISTDSGLVTRILPRQGSDVIPRFAGLNAYVKFDGSTVCQYINCVTDIRFLEFERIRAISVGNLSPINGEMELLWNGGSCVLTFKNQPFDKEKIKQTGALPFKCSSTTLSGPSWGPTTLTIMSIVPTGFEHIIVNVKSCAPLAVIWTLFLIRRLTLSLTKDCIKAPYLVLFPNSNYVMYNSNHLYFPAFPSFAIVFVRADTVDRSIAQDALRAWYLCEGLWPAYGQKALHMLNRSARIPTSPINNMQCRNMMEIYPMGKTFSPTNTPLWFEKCLLFKMRFDFLLLRLFLIINTGNEGLRIILECFSSWGSSNMYPLLPALTSFSDDLKYISPDWYNFLMGLVSMIVDAVEREATSMGFGIAAFIQDSFWGGIETCDRTPESIRDNCLLAAYRVVNEVLGYESCTTDLLKLSIEGSYTHALILNASNYWLFNIDSGITFLSGIAERCGITEQMKCTLTGILKLIAETEAIDDIVSKINKHVDDFIYLSLIHRGNLGFWSESTSGPVCVSERHVHELLRHATQLDLHLGGNLEIVYIRSKHSYSRSWASDGNSTPEHTTNTSDTNTNTNTNVFPHTLFSSPLCYDIDYTRHLQSKIDKLNLFVNAALQAKFYHKTEYKYQIPQFVFK